jgi:hypothetical protein
MSLGLKDGLLGLKTKLEDLESELTNQMLELELKAEEWHKRDEEAENIAKAGRNKIITLDVGGKKFQTKLDTLLSFKDTLFTKLFLSNRLDVTKDIFIDRPYTNFNYILFYLRNKKLPNESMNTQKFDAIFEEASFYEIKELIDIVEETRREIKYLKFEMNGPYNYSGQVAGTNNIEDLNNFEDKSLSRGICANSPGWIIIELTREAEFDEILIGGWNGNVNLWGASNGSGAQIMTSVDKTTWTTVGSIPHNFASVIQTVKLNRKVNAKWVKFQHNSYLGIGYFMIKKL